MDYKSSIVVSLEITFGILIPVPPYRVSKKNFFEISFLKVTKTNKSTTLITNFVILNYKKGSAEKLDHFFLYTDFGV